MRAVKVTLGVTVLAALIIVGCGWIFTNNRPVPGAGELYLGEQTERFVRFVQEKFGYTRADAVRFMHRASRENGGARIIDRTEIPPGALVDFIEVDGSKGGKPTVRFLGTGRALPAFSAEGIAFWNLFKRAALRKGWRTALKAMADLRRRGIVVAPAWFGSGSTAGGRAARSVGTSATGATTIRVAVICARFPEWRDQAPWSDGVTQSYSAGTHYAPDDTGTLRNVEGSTAADIDWYIDSPGGRMLSNGGVPMGTQVQWNDLHPSRDPATYDGPTVVKMQDYWYSRMFDINFGGSGAGTPSWPGSLRNYYWDNSHGVISITGQRTDIYGWVESHHILDRLPYPQGPAPVYMIQPGTPLIRKSSEIIAADGVGHREILRASLTGEKMTILYEHEFPIGTTPPWPQLWVYQTDIDGSASGDQNGWAQILLSAPGATTVIPDPYDRRRWTYVNESWEFVDAGDPTKTIDFDIWPGAAWRVYTSYGTTYWWRSGGTGSGAASDPSPGPPVHSARPQDQGCGALPNTLFTSADVLGSDVGNRFKSFDYYCHDHFVDTSRGPYQIEYLLHGSYRDDIGGETEPVDARKPRPFPFDCGMPQALGGSDQMQFGFFHYPGNDNQGGHDAGEMRADVNAAMADMGLTLAGPYDRIVYVFAGPGVGEGGGGSVGSWGTIICHAGGNMVTVGEDVSLTVMAHEMGHTFGMADLYDNDFYTNALSAPPPNPQYFECNGLGPYSVMAHGVRVDAWHLVRLGWLAADRIVALQDDHPNAEIPAVEGVLREPIIYKLPANPYYIVDGTAPGAWQEYFLVEYRYKTGADWYGDQSRPGVYIYHVDERNIGGFQRAEPTLTVAMEQADGLFELENRLAHPMSDYPGVPTGPGDIDGDPFPGSVNNRNFCQWDFNLEEWLGGSSTPTPVPTSYSHGDDDGAGHIVGGTDTDSFTRVLNIQLNGPIAYADIYVKPREIIVTGTDAWRDIVNGDGVVDYLAWQGLENVALLRLTLDNHQFTPGSYEYMSTGDVTVQEIRVVESGSSPNDTDVEQAKLWVDNGDALFDPATDTLLATATVQNQEAWFRQLNYEIPLGQVRNLFVTYDVSRTAQINPKVTIGADLPEPRYVWPEPPGTVQVRERGAAQWAFGDPRFPVQSPVGEVLEGTDTLFVSSSSLAPAAVHPNDQRVPVLRLLMNVDHDRAVIRRLRFNCNPDAGVGHAPKDPQNDVDLAELWLDVDQDGAVDASTDQKLAEAVFSNDTELIFDGLDLSVDEGASLHLIVTFDIAGGIDLSGGAHWLELEVPTWYDDNGTPADPSDDTYYITLVDEDGPNNTYYQNPADSADIRDIAHGADPSTWRIVAGQDAVDVGGAPWKSIDFAIQPPDAPVLSNASIANPAANPPTEPYLRHGSKSDVFVFGITYTSAAGLVPEYVRLVYRHKDWAAGVANQEVLMHETDPSDTDVTDGKRYEVQLTASDFPDWGMYVHYFTASDGYTPVYYYDPDGPGAGDPEGSYDENYRAGGPRQKATDPDLQEWLPGPILGTLSVLNFTDATWVQVDEYEEGQPIYIELADEDENVDPAAPDTVDVTVQSLTTGDTEPLTLTESGNDTGVFRGTMPTIGQVDPDPATPDGTLHVVAGASGQQIQVTYQDKDYWPNPGDIDSTQDTATVVDTTPPAKVLPGALVLASGPQGRTIDVDWTGYDEAAQIDIDPDGGYKVYCSDTNFATVGGMGPSAQVPPGTQTATIDTYWDAASGTLQPIQPDTRYYIAVTAYDEVPNEDTAVTTTNIRTEDNTGPQIVQRIPDDGDTDVPLDQIIQVHLQDAGSGMKLNALTFEVRVTNRGHVRQPRVDVSNWINITGDDYDATITFDPRDVPERRYPELHAGWTWNDVVDVWVFVEDRDGNALPPAQRHWSFSVLADVDPPEVDMATLSPAADETQVGFSEPISFDMTDDVSGIDESTLQVELRIVNRGVERQPWTDITGDPGFSVVYSSDFTIATIAYDPADDWQWNDEIWVRARATDRAGNAMADWQSWKFFALADTDDLAITSLDPDDGATDVARDTDIFFRVVDGQAGDQAGVDVNTITLEVNGQDVTADLQIQGDPFDYEVTYDPPQDFGWGETVQCHATAQDLAGNTVTRDWTFTTIPDTNPPTILAISPTEDETDVPVDSNVVVRVTDGETGVDPASIVVQLTANGAAIAGQLTTQQNNGTVTATFDPDDPLPYETQIDVHVEASDNWGNTATLDYSFTTEPTPRYRIVGRVTDTDGNPLAAVTMELSGDAQATVLTDGNGYYQFVDLLAGNYTVRPSLTGWTFTPAQRQIDLTDHVDDADFQGTQQTYALSGRVTVGTFDGPPLEGVTISVDGRQTTTDDQGRWEIAGLPAGDYTIVPSLANYEFDPSSIDQTITNADVTDLNFRAIPTGFSISGMVTDEQGNRLEGVRVIVDGRIAVTSETGRYHIGGIDPGTVQVSCEKQGWSFIWQDEGGVWQRGPRPVTGPPDASDINFVGYRSFTHAFSAGIHFIGVPAVPYDPSPESVFGTDVVARWDPSAATPGYVTPRLRPGSELLEVEPGRGFFVRFDEDVNLEVLGTPVNPDAPVSVGLAEGWNMQANPFDAQLAFGNVTATSGTIRPFGYVYDSVRGTYLLISETPGVGIDRSYLLPWEGVWLRALSTASVQFSPPTEPAAVKDVKSLQLDLGAQGWWLPIVARVGDRVDTCCAVGVRSSGGAWQLEKPPAMPGTVDVAVVAADGRRLARSVQVAGRAKYEWDLLVTTDIPEAEVQLLLPDLSHVPNDMSVTITDLETGKSVYARTMSSYRFRVGTQGVARRLRLTIAPRADTGLVVSAASARAAGGRVVVTYSVSAACRISARVLNIAGRPVRVLATDAPVAAGVNSLSWDGRNAAGAPAPGGVYLIEIEGVAANGQRVRTVTQVHFMPAR